MTRSSAVHMVQERKQNNMYKEVGALVAAESRNEARLSRLSKS
jgi:hypothetical protein